MTTKQLLDRVNCGVCLKGHFEVEITYRGKTYKTKSTNTMALDTINNFIANGHYFDSRRTDYYTSVKQPLVELYNECKTANDLR